jgi:hypothetical protein
VSCRFVLRASLCLFENVAGDVGAVLDGRAFRYGHPSPRKLAAVGFDNEVT